MVECNGVKKLLSLVIVQSDGPNLFGRDWLMELKYNSESISHITCQEKLQQVLKKHAAVFLDELGTIQGVSAKIYVNDNAKPVFCRPRPVPFAYRTKIEKELERLESRKVIEKVQFSDWVSPIVPVLKEDGSIRVCGDYKVTINKVSKLDSYPLPRMDDLFTAMSGGQYSSKLDLSHAYLQLQLDESSQKYLTINTHRGLYKYTRLPFGVSSAPSIFQRAMDSLLQGLPYTLTTF